MSALGENGLIGQCEILAAKVRLMYRNDLLEWNPFSEEWKFRCSKSCMWAPNGAILPLLLRRFPFHQQVHLVVFIDYLKAEPLIQVAGAVLAFHMDSYPLP